MNLFREDGSVQIEVKVGGARREINLRLSAWKSAKADSVEAMSPQDFHVLRSGFIRDGQGGEVNFIYGEGNGVFDSSSILSYTESKFRSL